MTIEDKNQTHQEKRKLPDNQIAVYQTPDGKVNIEVLYANEKHLASTETHC